MERYLRGVRYRAASAREGELGELHRFCTGVVPGGFAGLELWRERHGKNPNIFYAVKARGAGPDAGPERLVGSFAVTPVNEEARALLEREQLKGMGFKVGHIAAPDETPAAVYISGIVAEGFEARGVTLGFLNDTLAREAERGSRLFYTRPMSADGMRLVGKFGFNPVDPTARGQFDRIYKKVLT